VIRNVCTVRQFTADQTEKIRFGLYQLDMRNPHKAQVFRPEQNVAAALLAVLDNSGRSVVATDGGVKLLVLSTVIMALMAVATAVAAASFAASSAPLVKNSDAVFTAPPLFLFKQVSVYLLIGIGIAPF